jgi:hypothetical protein
VGINMAFEIVFLAHAPDASITQIMKREDWFL